MFDDHTIADNRARFGELMGSDLEWLNFATNHCHLFLRVSGAPRGRGLIFFIYLQYVDGPLKVCNVRLRLATEEEWEAARLRFPANEGNYPVDKNDCLIIEGSEGHALIVANQMFVAWEDEGTPILMQAEQSDGRLWEGGPPLSAL